MIDRKLLAAAGIIVVLFLAMFVFKIKIITTIIISAAAGVAQFLAGKYQIRIDTGHIFFLGVLLARSAGIPVAFVFMVIAGFLPKVLSGDIDPAILVAYSTQTLIVAISGLFDFHIVWFGIALTIISYTLILLLTLEIDLDLPEVIDDTIVPAALNIFYFASLSGTLLNLFTGLYS